MVILIKQHNGGWRLLIQNEEWEFPDRAGLDKAIKTILDIKETNGQLNGCGK